MTPEVDGLFANSAEAGDFLVEIADKMAKFVSGGRNYKIGYPHYYPDTWMVEEGAHIIESTVKILSHEDSLGLIPELMIIHAYLGKLIWSCEESEVDFVRQNMKWSTEVPEGTLNQPIGRLKMFAGIEDARQSVEERLRFLLPG